MAIWDFLLSMADLFLWAILILAVLGFFSIFVCGFHRVLGRFGGPFPPRS